MKVLLDTNALLWQLGLQQNKLGPQATKLMRTADTVYVSAVSIIDLHIKTMIGKLNAPANCEQMIQDAGDSLLSLSATAADALRAFPTLQRHDPFDRMLLAQAQTEGLLFITSDTTLLALGLDFLTDARK